MTIEERTKRINEAEKKLREVENLRVACLTREEQYKAEVNKSIEELEKLGTSPENAEQKIKELENEMNSLLTEIENNIPSDLLK